MAAPVTLMYGGFLGLILVGLTTRVVVGRWQTGVGIGHGDSKSLRRWIRVHANFAEHVPLIVLLLLLCEINGLDARWLHASGLGLVISRLLHAFGLSRHPGVSAGRFIGSLVSMFILSALGLWAVWSALI